MLQMSSISISAKFPGNFLPVGKVRYKIEIVEHPPTIDETVSLKVAHIYLSSIALQELINSNKILLLFN
jgi:hypothetical protein